MEMDCKSGRIRLGIMQQYVMKNQKKLKCGMTTGTCAAAAAAAAARDLLSGGGREDSAVSATVPKGGREDSAVSVTVPKGVTLEVPVSFVEAGEDFCEYMVTKDSGDDPDVTDGCRVHARLERVAGETATGKTAFRSDRYPNLFLEGGSGIGRVTREGLEQAVGQAAINAVPRKMIFQAVGQACEVMEYTGCIKITISIPEGRELAARTFNPNLGIEGGISVLGTSGIVEPMSERAVVDTIEAQIRQRAAEGRRFLLVTPGNYGQAYASEYLHLNLEQSIKCSNYIGETIDLAVSYGMEQFLLTGNIGKLVKLAAGIMNTHSKIADGRGEVFAVHAVLCGGTREMAAALLQCVNTDEMLTRLEEWNLREAVMESICEKIRQHMERRIGGKMEFGAVVFSEKFGFLGMTTGAQDLIHQGRME